MPSRSDGHCLFSFLKQRWHSDFHGDCPYQASSRSGSLRRVRQRAGMRLREPGGSNQRTQIDGAPTAPSF